jgi:hypothetical protein
MSLHGLRELVTIDFFGSLPGNDRTGEYRVVFNNCYDCRGSTEYFIGKQRNGSPFAVDWTSQNPPHFMLDWGEFTPTIDLTSPPTAAGDRKSVV